MKKIGKKGVLKMKIVVFDEYGDKMKIVEGATFDALSYAVRRLTAEDIVDIYAAEGYTAKIMDTKFRVVANYEVLEEVFSRKAAEEIVEIYESADRAFDDFTPDYYNIMEVEVEHDGQSDRIHDEIDLQTKNVVRNDLSYIINERRGNT